MEEMSSVLINITNYITHLPTLCNWYSVSRWHRQYLDLQIGQLMTFIEQKIRNDLFKFLIDSNNKTFLDPDQCRVKYYLLGRMAKIINVNNFMTPRPLWLLAQCCKKITSLYGWRMNLFDDDTKKILTLPWQQQHSDEDIALTFQTNDEPFLADVSTISSQTLILPEDCLMAITEFAIQSPSFFDIRAYFAWFATCRHLRSYFIHQSEQLLPLLKEKKQALEIQCIGKIEVYYYNQFASVLHAIRIETLMVKLSTLSTFKFDELFPLFGDTNVDYILWLLAQCRQKINVRYNRQLTLSRYGVDVVFPWRDLHPAGVKICIMSE
jgi:hypothetical protein